jgi:hypothetical protein
MHVSGISRSVLSITAFSIPTPGFPRTKDDDDEI